MNKYSMFEDPNELKLESEYGTEISPVESAGMASMAAKSGGNPALIAGMVGLKALQAHKARKEKEKMERYAAQVNTSNRMQSALGKLANIGSALKLG
jgi:hypothetical protein